MLNPFHLRSLHTLLRFYCTKPRKPFVALVQTVPGLLKINVGNGGFFSTKLFEGKDDQLRQQLLSYLADVYLLPTMPIVCHTIGSNCLEKERKKQERKKERNYKQLHVLG